MEGPGVDPKDKAYDLVSKSCGHNDNKKGPENSFYQLNNIEMIPQHVAFERNDIAQSYDYDREQIQQFEKPSLMNRNRNLIPVYPKQFQA